MELTAPSLPTTQPAPQTLTADQLARRGEIQTTAKAFEATFLSVMLSQMFKDVGAEAPFNGGHGEEAFKSFLSEAMAKQMVDSGGIGLTDNVAREMLKLQGLS